MRSLHPLVVTSLSIQVAVLIFIHTLYSFTSMCDWFRFLISTAFPGIGSQASFKLRLCCNSVEVHHASVTSDPTRWRFTPDNLTGACKPRSLGPILSVISWPVVQSLSFLFFSFSFFPTKIRADPILGQYRPSCWPISKPHSSQTCSVNPLHSLCSPRNHSRSPSHSATTNWKPAISNLTHFADC